MSLDSTKPQLVCLGGETYEFTKLSDLPRPVAVAIGRELGISPIIFLGAPEGSMALSIWDHLEVLADAATTLGYVGVTPAQVASDLLEHPSSVGAPYVLVALVPDPLSHKAAPPGFNWFLHVEAFDPGWSRVGRSGAAQSIPELMKVGVSQHLRNHHDPISRVLLWDEIVLSLTQREARGLGMDAMLIMNTEHRLASIGWGAVLVSFDGRFVTPPLSEGAIDTSWRRHMLFSGEMTEAQLTLSDLRHADQIVYLAPWGERRIVEVDRVGETEQR